MFFFCFVFFSSPISVNLLINMGRTKVFKTATTEIKVLCLTASCSFLFFFFFLFPLRGNKKWPHLKELFRFRYQQRSSGGKTVKHAICSHIINIQKKKKKKTLNHYKLI